MQNTLRSDKELGAALADSIPELARLQDAAAGVSLYLVGGAVRDLLLGQTAIPNLDLVVEGDAAAVAAALGEEVLEHERFATAKVQLGDREVDLASARAETYSSPGALPTVSAATLAEDLRRRDFTVNAMAIPLQGTPALVDPLGGRDDLAAGILRALHPRSFADDPTRALRAARYAARFDFDLAPETRELLPSADLATVSEDRQLAELTRIAAEPRAVRALELLGEWNLLELSRDRLELLRELDRLLRAPPWSEVASRASALLAVARGQLGCGPQLAAAQPARPSQAVTTARGASPEELAIGRALGGLWLDDYIARWRSVVLEISGDDLIAAGVAPGPALGKGLAAALDAKLDGELSGREQELEAALAAARAES
jgi:tRNA nucleotidyltransferase (CCA-adding enzyme)